jgi:hypothetical protein
MRERREARHVAEVAKKIRLRTGWAGGRVPTDGHGRYPQFSDSFRRQFNPRDVDRVTVLAVRGRLTAEDFENLRIEVEGACRAGWRGVVCDVADMGDAADFDGQLEHLVGCYTALSRAGAVFNFLHVKRLLKHWEPGIMPPPPLGFECEAEAAADVRARCAGFRR